MSAPAARCWYRQVPITPRPPASGARPWIRCCRPSPSASPRNRFIRILATPAHALPGPGAPKAPPAEPPRWSRFFRTVDTRNTTTPPVMTGADGKPLLLLARYGEGRVALLLSDHIWLWARGYEGGGPHLDLLRRMSHWLMKQPDLDEEALRLQVQGHDLVVLRQTMADSVAPVTVTSPTGASRELTLSATEPGTWTAAILANELGLWKATDGTLKALINVGPTNPKEFSEVTSTTEMLKPLTQATGGDARRVVDGSSVELPRIVPVRASGVFRGDGWVGVKMRDASVVKGVGVLPVFAGLIGLLLLLGAFAATWLREGR